MGCSLFTLHPLSTHPLGFSSYIYFQINSPIRNLSTKAVLKAMTLYICKLALLKPPLKPKARSTGSRIPGLTLPPSAHSHTWAPAMESRLCYFFPHRGLSSPHPVLPSLYPPQPVLCRQSSQRLRCGFCPMYSKLI